MTKRERRYHRGKRLDKLYGYAGYGIIDMPRTKVTYESMQAAWDELVEIERKRDGFHVKPIDPRTPSYRQMLSQHMGWHSLSMTEDERYKPNNNG